MSADVVWYKTIPEIISYRPLNVPKFEEVLVTPLIGLRDSLVFVQILGRHIVFCHLTDRCLLITTWAESWGVDVSELARFPEVLAKNCRLLPESSAKTVLPQLTARRWCVQKRLRRPYCFLPPEPCELQTPEACRIFRNGSAQEQFRQGTQEGAARGFDGASQAIHSMTSIACPLSVLQLFVDCLISAASRTLSSLRFSVLSVAFPPRTSSWQFAVVSCLITV